MSTTIDETPATACGLKPCDRVHPGTRDDAAADGWLVASHDPAVPVLCPLHAEHLTKGSHHVFGPEYETLASRVPVVGDTLITAEGVFMRAGGHWLPEYQWAGDAA